MILLIVIDLTEEMNFFKVLENKYFVSYPNQPGLVTLL